MEPTFRMLHLLWMLLWQHNTKGHQKRSSQKCIQTLLPEANDTCVEVQRLLGVFDPVHCLQHQCACQLAHMRRAFTQ